MAKQPQTLESIHRLSLTPRGINKGEAAGLTFGRQRYGRPVHPNLEPREASHGICQGRILYSSLKDDFPFHLIVDVHSPSPSQNGAALRLTTAADGLVTPVYFSQGPTSDLQWIDSTRLDPLVAILNFDCSINGTTRLSMVLMVTCTVRERLRMSRHAAHHVTYCRCTNLEKTRCGCCKAAAAA